MARPKRTRRTIVEEDVEPEVHIPEVMDPDTETLEYVLRSFDSKDGLEVKYYLVTPNGSGFVGAYADLIPETQLQEWYPAGGKFEVRFYIHGEFRDRRFVSIAPRPGSASSGGGDSFLREILQEMRTEMRTMRQAPTTPVGELAQALKAMHEISRPATDSAPNIIELIKLGVQIASSGGKFPIEEDDSFSGVVKGVLKEAGPAIVQGLMMGRNGGGSSVPVQQLQQVSPEEAGVMILKQGILWLKKKAAAGKDPLLYADLVGDNAETDERAQYIVRSIAASEFDVFAQLDPEIGNPPYREFFKAFYDRIRTGADASDSMDDDTSGPRGNVANIADNGGTSKAGRK